MLFLDSGTAAIDDAGIVLSHGITTEGAPLAAAAFVAFMPQVIYHSSHVSNDVLAAAFSALALWLLARLVRLGVSPWRALAVGAAQGLAEWGDPRALPALLRFIDDPLNNERARSEACVALVQIAPQAELPRLLEPLEVVLSREALDFSDGRPMAVASVLAQRVGQ